MRTCDGVTADTWALVEFDSPPRHNTLIIDIMTLKEFCKITGFTEAQATGKEVTQI